MAGITWTKERYLKLRELYNKAEAAGDEIIIFEDVVILTWFAYIILQGLHARFEH